MKHPSDAGPSLTPDVDEEGEVGGGDSGYHGDDGVLHGPPAAGRHLHQELQLPLSLWRWAKGIRMAWVLRLFVWEELTFLILLLLLSL